MTRAAWAERKVDAICRWTSDSLRALVIKLLLAEHKRAVNVVKALEKAATLGQYDMSEAVKRGFLLAIKEAIAALQKGRT